MMSNKESFFGLIKCGQALIYQNRFRGKDICSIEIKHQISTAIIHKVFFFT